MGLFSKKKEETKSCCCGGNCTPETMAQAETAKAASGVKVLGTGCAKCNALEDAVRAALTELGMDTTIDHVTDFTQIAAYGVMTTPALVVDGLTDGVWLMNDGNIAQDDIDDTAFGILQAARLRTSKTEYISCPGCGRTLYDLRETIAKIRKATQDMKGLKIGIMGCIVNGPGEMADADYGYVGAGPKRVSLYRKQVCVEKNIPEEEAVEHLLALIHKDQRATGA